MFWVFAALLCAFAAAAIVLPGLRRPSTLGSRTDFDRAVYRDQLAEIARDVDRGVLTPEQAATARLEVERRLIATRDEPTTVQARHTGRVVQVALAALVVICAGTLYLGLGSPAVRDQPIATRVPPDAPKDLAEGADRLARRLEQNPDDGEGWLLLARTQAVLERHRAAAESYRHAMELTGNAEAAAGYGEMLVLSSNGIVTPAARDAFRTAVEKDPANPPARYYLALAEAQAGRPAEAIESWRKLEAESPPGAPWRETVRQRIVETAREAGLPAPEPPRGPSAADIAAAQQKSPEEREAMVRGMVENLAARLRETPDDVAGWQRLGRAYRVLGEKEQAAAAFARVAELRPEDKDALLDHARAVIETLGGDPHKKLPEKAVTELRKVLEMEPRNGEALWYLGLAAAQEHKREEAAGYWQRLLAVLPPEGDDAKMVETALKALTGG
jgi:cytochrome c-type biogenesis protein CcmH